jgi:hypothetical protein
MFGVNMGKPKNQFPGWIGLMYLEHGSAIRLALQNRVWQPPKTAKHQPMLSGGSPAVYSSPVV